MKNELRVPLFAVIFAVVCALLLAGANQVFGPYTSANEKAEQMRTYLSVLSVPVPAKASASDLIKIFDDNVKVSKLGNGTDLYAYAPAGKDVQAYAVPFSGAGLWGPVDGVIALKPDLRTIKAISFYKQEETPGLGGEIGAKWFQDEFVGKKIVSTSGVPGFKLVKTGKPTDQNSVDGITGATLTSNRVGIMLTDIAKVIVEKGGAYVQ